LVTFSLQHGFLYHGHGARHQAIATKLKMLLYQNQSFECLSILKNHGHSEKPESYDTNLTLPLPDSGDLNDVPWLFTMQLNIFIITKWYEVVCIPLLCVLEL
jgi:hypothetical protein